jgi:translation initiation factor IF-2
MPNKEVKSAEEGTLIGKITHYFGHLEVAVIELIGTIKVGDTIRIIGGETDFNQPVESIQYEHENIKEAGKGKSVGMKVIGKVHEGYKVYKI